MFMKRRINENRIAIGKVPKLYCSGQPGEGGACRSRFLGFSLRNLDSGGLERRPSISHPPFFKCLFI